MPTKRKFRSIKNKALTRLFITVFSFVILLTSLITYGSYLSELHQSRDAVLHDAADMARSLDLLFEHSRKNVRTIASLGDLKDFVNFSYQQTDKLDIDDKDYLADKEYIRSELEEFNLGNQYKSIYIMDRTGYVLVATDKTFEDKNFVYRDYFQAAIRGDDFTDAVIGSISNELGFFFSTPVYGQEGDVIAVIVAKFGAERVYELLAESAEIANADIFLVSQNQQIIYAKEEEDVFDFLTMPSVEVLDKLKIKEENVSLADEKLRAFSNKIKDYQKIEFFHLPEIKEKNFVLNKSLDGMFFIVVGQDVDAVLEQPRKLAILSTILILSMSLALILAVYFLIKYLVKPIDTLKIAAEKIAKNEWDYSLDFYDRNDEFGELANSFDQMAKQIKENQENLSAEVEKKTTVLQEKLMELEKLTNVMADRELKMIEMKKQFGLKENTGGEKNEG